jgi:tetratricopeptide (TPR) repeat protein
MAAPRRRAVRPPPSSPTLAAALLGAFAAAMAVALFAGHRVPLYGVETDLFGEFIPAARALLAGRPDPGHYAFKGPGYPLLLAASTAATLGDAWFAARLLNLAAALAAAGCAFLLVRRTVGEAAGLFVLAALCANPVFVRATLEAGTDVPAFALSLAATLLALSAASPRAAAAAGFVAGCAILCRYNAAFLVPAGLVAVVAGPGTAAGRAPRAGAYLLGVAIPLAPWLAINRGISGSALGNANYANLAFELYGRGMPWDRFWAEVAPRFRSYADVLLYDPGGALLHWVRNLGTRWLTDLRQLVPVWLGAAAVLGVALHARRAPARAALLFHFALCYATLALVFYTPRFFLYLVPFYLAAAALALFPLPRDRAAAPAPRPARAAPWRIAAAVAAIVASAVVAVRETRTLLAEAPSEVLAAGAALRPLARPGDRLIARKPQVAYFAGMEYAPFPQVETLQELLAEARRAGAGYLNISGIEGALRPQFRLLEQPGAALPGYTLVGSDTRDPQRYWFAYRLEPAGPADAGFADSLRAALRRLAAAHPGDAPVQSYVGVLLLDEGRTAEALVFLDRAVELAPGHAQSRGYRAVALADAGRLEEAARDCEQVIASLARPPASFHVLLGSIRARQHRLDDAQAAFDAAARLEPANVTVQLVRGFVLLARGEAEAGRESLDRAVRLAPEVAPIRDVALERARRYDVAGLERLVELTRRSIGSGAPAAALADSARAALSE